MSTDQYFIICFVSVINKKKKTFKDYIYFMF